MPAKFKTSAQYKIKMHRLSKVPKIADQVMMGATKKEGMRFYKIFHDGIKKNEFGLEELMENTKSTKKRQGFAKPDIPLYGKGDKADNQRSYSSMMRLRKLKNGWRVYPSWAKHWKSKLTLRQLLDVHEKGRIIKRGNSLIRIPPRPAFLFSMRKFYKKFSREKLSRDMKKAIKEYVNTGTSKYFDEMINYYKNKDVQFTGV